MTKLNTAVYIAPIMRVFFMSTSSAQFLVIPVLTDFVKIILRVTNYHIVYLRALHR